MESPLFKSPGGELLPVQKVSPGGFLNVPKVSPYCSIVIKVSPVTEALMTGRL
jgi:hypothetical protein